MAWSIFGLVPFSIFHCKISATQMSKGLTGFDNCFKVMFIFTRYGNGNKRLWLKRSNYSVLDAANTRLQGYSIPVPNFLPQRWQGVFNSYLAFWLRLQPTFQDYFIERRSPRNADQTTVPMQPLRCTPTNVFEYSFCTAFCGLQLSQALTTYRSSRKHLHKSLRNSSRILLFLFCLYWSACSR